MTGLDEHRDHEPEEHHELVPLVDGELAANIDHEHESDHKHESDWHRLRHTDMTDHHHDIEPDDGLHGAGTAHLRWPFLLYR